MRKSKVLVVDDSLIIRKILVKQLEGFGYTVLPVASGAEALERLDGESFDCMILDLHMEGLTGYEVLERVAQKGHSLPVVVLSADMQIASAEKAKLLGAREFLIKPPNPVELKNVLEHVLNH